MSKKTGTSVPPDPAQVVARADEAGHGLAPGQAEALALYLELLMQWNARMNLVGARTWEQAFDDLAADSLHLAALLRELAALGALPIEPLCLDLGAGAGLPGIPLRIVWPHGTYHMIEPREKRALFLGVALARLGLPGTHAIRSRAEDLPQALRRADLVVSRAFMPWRDYLALAKELLAPGGICLVMALDAFEGEPPEGFALVRQHAYEVFPEGAPQTRYFWCFTPESVSR